MLYTYTAMKHTKMKLVLTILLAITGFALYPTQNPEQTLPEKPATETTPEPETISKTLVPKQITLQNGEQFSLSIPEGFEIAPSAEGLGRARFMAKSPDGRLFVPDMKNLSDNSDGKIYILSNFNPQTKKFESKSIYLSGLRNPNSLAFHTEADGTHWLYLALTDKLVRYPYTAGDMEPRLPAETLATFPDYGLSYKYGGWHLTRTVAIKNNKVYVSVGSSCNSCEETEAVRATILEMNLDGSSQRTLASGLRNAVGIKFNNNDLYATAMGSDHLGDNKPEEALYKITTGTNYGWPHCYQFEGKIYTDDSKPWQQKADCTTVPLADAVFPAHSAPLGLEFFGGGTLVALHGSSDIALGHGYKIVKSETDGSVSDFITGFLEGKTRYGRPVDILKDTETSFFFTDDFAGVLYYVYKQ